MVYKVTVSYYYGHENSDGFTTFAYWVIGFTIYLFLLKYIWDIHLFDNIVVKSILIIVLSLYMFDYIYLLSGLSNISYGHAGFILVPLFLGAICIVGLLIVTILIDSRVYIYVFLIMLGSFIFFIAHEKYDYDIEQRSISMIIAMS